MRPAETKEHSAQAANTPIIPPTTRTGWACPCPLRPLPHARHTKKCLLRGMVFSARYQAGPMTLEKLGTYAIEKRLSAHQNREVFLAHDGVQTVILKRLRLGQMRDWKAMQLFEREADTLKALRHPRIPRLLDSFHEEQAGQTSLMMVMEYVAGPSLADRLKQGWRPREPEVLEIARQGLEILSYLHQHDPPVIHRDIKPSNLIWTD
ncbi:MAG: hypothetical protein CVV27_04960, partial [Candidatus Melainabacteria bacterium HGW-Melainabacteria-1]